MKKHFSRKEVSAILGIRKCRIQYYVDCGIVIPAIDSTGSGTHRKFSFSNIVEIHTAMFFTRIGVGIIEVRKIVDYVRNVSGDCDIIACCFIGQAVDGFFCLSGSGVIEKLNEYTAKGYSVICFSLQKIVSDIREKVIGDVAEHIVPLPEGPDTFSGLLR